MSTSALVELYPLAIVGEDWVRFIDFIHIPDGLYSMDDPRVRTWLEALKWYDKTKNKSSSP